jgi:hypothetical protein
MNDIEEAMGGEFIPADVPDSGTGDPVPAGWYTLGIEEAEMKKTNAGTGTLINLKTVIIAPEQFKGRNVFTNINIANPSEKCQAIGRQALAQLSKALNIVRLKQSIELVNGIVLGKVKVEPESIDKVTGKTYAPKNDISGFKAVGDATANVAAPVTPAATPAAQQAPAAAPAQAAAAPAAAGKRPWE